MVFVSASSRRHLCWVACAAAALLLVWVLFRAADAEPDPRDLRAQLTHVLREEADSMHRTLWRAGHLARASLEGRPWEAVERELAAHGIRDGEVYESWNDKSKFELITFVAQRRAFRRAHALAHALDLLVWIGRESGVVDRARMRLRVVGSHEYEELCRSYPKESVGDLFLRHPIVEGLGALYRVTQLAFEWKFNGGAWSRANGVKVSGIDGHVVFTCERCENEVTVLLSTVSDLDPPRKGDRVDPPTATGPGKLEPFDVGRHSVFGSRCACPR